jgi:hypothetical protein
LPYLACISDDYAFFFKMNVIALSSVLSSDLAPDFCLKKQGSETIFFPHLYSFLAQPDLFFRAGRFIFL